MSVASRLAPTLCASAHDGTIMANTIATTDITIIDNIIDL